MLFIEEAARNKNFSQLPASLKFAMQADFVFFTHRREEDAHGGPDI